MARVVRHSEQGGAQVHGCPECMERFAGAQVKDLRENAFAWRSLMKLPVACPLGCPWEGDVGDFDTHFNSCPEAQCTTCSSAVKLPATMEDHYPVCPRVLVPAGLEYLVREKFWAGPFRFTFGAFIGGGTVQAGVLLDDQRLRWATIRFAALAVDPVGSGTAVRSYPILLGDDRKIQPVVLAALTNDTVFEFRNGVRWLKVDFRVFLQDWQLAADAPTEHNRVESRILWRSELVEAGDWQYVPF
ncbi:hypothetical protein DFJ74DRAFT_765686 [Hyaloraphidium curvatum]|nr:hypothetical protein DFJ74DRAFT_765686 [Hyaloraphidium curvatum]